jgi:inhibitor of cysteine peptidase
MTVASVAPLEVTAQSQGGTVALAPGQAIVIRLAENPATGYRWAVETCGAMQLDADDYQSTGQTIGGSGIRCWRWSSSKHGTSLIALVLKRSWEPENVPIGRFQLTVVH